MKLESPYLRNRAKLELTSLMDVMFLVLVFFVYATFSMSVHKGVKVELPAAAGAQEAGERIVVTIARDESLQLNGRALGRDQLVAEVARLVAVKPELPVLVSGDRGASLGAGVELLAALKASGVEKVSFQVSGKQGR